MKETIYNYLSTNGIDISQAHGAGMLNQSYRSSVLSPKEYPEYYWALNESFARSFVNLCYQERCPIIGIDIIIKEDGKYTLSWDVWCYQRKNSEDDNSYLVHSIEGAREYMSYFSQKNVLYSFTINDD